MRPCPLGAAFLIFAAATLTAEENSANIFSAMKDRAVVLQLTARVVEREAAETWNSATSKVTIPGRPVTLKLVGANVVVAAQFTPYKTEDGKIILVAQGQVWISTKDEGMLYYTSMQTIPIEYGERVYFFPLGQKKDDHGARIEVQLVLNPYVEGGTSTQPSGGGAKPDTKTAPAQPPAASPGSAAPAAGPKTESKAAPKPEPKAVPAAQSAAQSTQQKEEKTTPASKSDGEKREAE